MLTVQKRSLRRRTKIVEPKQFHDAMDYYNRLDVPALKINRKQLTPITEEGLPDTGGNIAAPGTDAP